ncbi:MAG: DUF4397 domain-containing protein [Naasia sp.]
MSSTPQSSRAIRSRLSRLLAIGAGVLIAAAGVAVPSAAHAAPGDTGWVRVAHLSPDTKAVDVELTAVSGGESLYQLSDIGYGVVSDYMSLPVGTYTVSMVGAGSPEGTAPAITATVDVAAGNASTLAAFGRNADLQTKVFSDDLTAPADGAARVRLVQASTTADEVDVATSTGLAIASRAASGSATSYAQVPSGPWDLDVTGTRAAQTGMASIDLPAGSVATLFVLDEPDGSLTVKPVIDSASVGMAPIGGVETGGGALARAGQDDGAPVWTLAASVSALLVLAGAALVVRARRAASAETAEATR